LPTIISVGLTKDVSEIQLPGGRCSDGNCIVAIGDDSIGTHFLSDRDHLQADRYFFQISPEFLEFREWGCSKGLLLYEICQDLCFVTRTNNVNHGKAGPRPSKSLLGYHEFSHIPGRSRRSDQIEANRQRAPPLARTSRAR